MFVALQRTVAYNNIILQRDTHDNPFVKQAGRRGFIIRSGLGFRSPFESRYIR